MRFCCNLILSNDRLCGGVLPREMVTETVITVGIDSGWAMASGVSWAT